MRQLQILFQGNIQLTPKTFDVLWRSVLLHVPHIRYLSRRHRCLLTVLARTPSFVAMLVLRMHHVLEVPSIMRVHPHAKHRRIVLMRRRLRLRVLRAGTHDDETCLSREWTLHRLGPVLPHPVLVVLVRRVRVGVELELGDIARQFLLLILYMSIRLVSTAAQLFSGTYIWADILFLQFVDRSKSLMWAVPGAQIDTICCYSI